MVKRALFGIKIWSHPTEVINGCFRFQACIKIEDFLCYFTTWSPLAFECFLRMILQPHHPPKKNKHESLEVQFSQYHDLSNPTAEQECAVFFAPQVKMISDLLLVFRYHGIWYMAHPGFIDEKVTAMPVALIAMTQAGRYQDEKQDVVGFILMGEGWGVKSCNLMQSSTQIKTPNPTGISISIPIHLGIDIMLLSMVVL